MIWDSRSMRDFRKLQVWVKAHELTLEIYRVTENFPAIELYGLRAQIRRAAMSMGSNIAEGAGRHTDTDFARFLDIASGSTHEVEYQALLTRDLGYITSEIHLQIDSGANEIKRMLASLTRRLRTNTT